MNDFKLYLKTSKLYSILSDVSAILSVLVALCVVGVFSTLEIDNTVTISDVLPRAFITALLFGLCVYLAKLFKSRSDYYKNVYFMNKRKYSRLLFEKCDGDRLKEIYGWK